MSSPGAHGLGERIGHSFADEHLASTALRHRSWCAEHGGAVSNERLEFLGDSVLGLVITDRLYRTCPHSGEGDLARLRAELVSSRALADVAQACGLGELVLLGRGEEATAGRSKSSILADTMEAVLGSVFLDGGLDAAAAVIDRCWGTRIDSLVASGPIADNKSRLQELAARLALDVPRYQMAESGPEHDKRFVAEVHAGDVVSRGEGRTKKDAEQEAAAGALAILVAGEIDRGAVVLAADGRTTSDE